MPGIGVFSVRSELSTVANLAIALGMILRFTEVRTRSCNWRGCRGGSLDRTIHTDLQRVRARSESTLASRHVVHGHRNKHCANGVTYVRRLLSRERGGLCGFRQPGDNALGRTSHPRHGGSTRGACASDRSEEHPPGAPSQPRDASAGLRVSGSCYSRIRTTDLYRFCG
jgi:hypothetical protein